VEAMFLQGVVDGANAGLVDDLQAIGLTDVQIKAILEVPYTLNL